MSMLHRSANVVAILILGSCLVAGDAFAKHGAGGVLKDQQSARQGCKGVVKLDHSGLKGDAFKAEVDKCAADPNGYSKS